MRILIPIGAAVAAIAAAAVVLFHPAAPAGLSASAGSGASGWSTPAPAAAPAPRRSALPRPVVYVAGAVVHPGVYTLAPDGRVGDALARAGGGRPDADLVAVNLAARVHDGDEIAVPVRGAAPVAVPVRRGLAPPGAGATRRRDRPAPAGGGGRRGRRRSAAADAAAAPPPDTVDLNAADATTLQTLPGIGPALAARIVLFREANGPFGSADELLDVAGITERRLDLILPYVEVR